MTHRTTTISIALLIACCGMLSLTHAAQAIVGGPAGTAPMAKPSLSVTVNTDASTVHPGNDVTFTVVIENTGKETASSLVLRDTLPKGFTVVPTSSSTYTYAFEGTLEPGKSITAAYTATVSDNVTTGTYADNVTVSATLASSVNAHTAINVTIPRVKGAETIAVTDPIPTLAETGVGQLDVFFALCGAALVAIGIVGLRRTYRI